jgi:hypothetical protein
MRRSLSALAVLGALAAGALFWFWPHSGLHAQPSPAPLNQEIAALRTEVRSLERDLRERPRPGGTTPPAAPERLATPPATEAEERPAKPPSNDEVIHQVVANCDARLVTEARDASWSRATEAAIQGAVSRSSSKARVLSADCASTLCRTVLENESLNDERELLSALSSQEPFTAGTLYQYDRTGQHPRATLYVAREGHRLDPENAPAAPGPPPGQSPSATN